MNALKHIMTPTGALRSWATLTVVIVAMGITMGATITYVVQRTKDICGIVVILDDRNRKLPPATDPDTAHFRAELHHYRERLGC